MCVQKVCETQISNPSEGESDRFVVRKGDGNTHSLAFIGREHGLILAVTGDLHQG